MKSYKLPVQPIANTRFVIIDTETTGFDTKNDKVVEISLSELLPGGIPGFTHSTLCDPEKHIPLDTVAIHHIQDATVAGAPILEMLREQITNLVGDSILVAHNAEFDRQFFPFLKNPWVCTYRLAQHLFPDLGRYSNQILRYYLNIQADVTTNHRAQDDAIVTRGIFQAMIPKLAQQNITKIPELVRFSEHPITVRMMPFGKHKGLSLGEIPTDYIRWALKNMDLDADLKWSLEQEIGD